MKTVNARAVVEDEPAKIRRRDREKTKAEILQIAFEEFAESGLLGANADAIAARAGITKRLIFYYFNSKEELFIAVLEMAYGKMRQAEEDLERARNDVYQCRSAERYFFVPLAVDCVGVDLRLASAEARLKRVKSNRYNWELLLPESPNP